MPALFAATRPAIAMPDASDANDLPINGWQLLVQRWQKRKSPLGQSGQFLKALVLPGAMYYRIAASVKRIAMSARAAATMRARSM